MADGILIIRKEKGFTSFDVVAVLRKLFHQKKIGHGGTLDPMAEGVLPVFLGNATRLCDLQGDAEKTYEAGILLGRKTDTEDIWGNILSELPVSCTEEEVRAAVQSFHGGYLQVPPMYSAKKQGGKKLYELAREGITVERKPVRVMIHEIRVDEVCLPELRVTVRCSKGTYIRSLARDIGERLGTGACMSSLLRTSHGRFRLEDALTLSELKEALEKKAPESLLIPVERMFTEYPAAVVKEEAVRLLRNGNKLPEDALILRETPENGAFYRILIPDGSFTAVYRYDAGNRVFSVFRMFLREDS